MCVTPCTPTPPRGAAVGKKMTEKPKKGPKSQKNLKVGVFETDFKQVPFLFRQITWAYSESWGPVENLCDPPHPHPPRGAAVGNKNYGKTEKMTKENFLCQNFFP